MTCPYARHCRMADLWTCRRRTNSTSCPLPLRLASAPFRPLPAVRSSLFPFSCASVRPSADRPTLAALIGTRHYIATDGRRAQQSLFRLARSETGRKLCARMVQSWVAPQKTPLTRCDWPEKPDAGHLRRTTPRSSATLGMRSAMSAIWRTARATPCGLCARRRAAGWCACSMALPAECSTDRRRRCRTSRWQSA